MGNESAEYLPLPPGPLSVEGDFGRGSRRTDGRALVA
jgi:hypothetical protein